MDCGQDSRVCVKKKQCSINYIACCRKELLGIIFIKMTEKEKERCMQQMWQSITTANVKSALINFFIKHTHRSKNKLFVLLEEKTSECPSNADKYWRISPSPPTFFVCLFYYRSQRGLGILLLLTVHYVAGTWPRLSQSSAPIWDFESWECCKDKGAIESLLTIVVRVPR